MKRVKRIFEHYKRVLGLEDVKLGFRDYKTKIASCSLKRRKITLSMKLLGMDDSVIRYIILHELLHLKLNSKFHGVEFHKLLEEFLTKGDVEKARVIVLKEILKRDSDD